MWTNNYIATIGVDFRFRTIEIDNKTIKLQIWDTAGHERFNSINTSYYRGCDGAILCYDVCQKATFKNIIYHLNQVQEKGEKNSVKILVANKDDVDDELKMVTYEDGQDLADQLNLSFFEISAKYNKNVEEAFEELGRQCIAMKKIEERRKSKQKEELKRLSGRKVSTKITSKDIKQALKYNGCC